MQVGPAYFAGKFWSADAWKMSVLPLALININPYVTKCSDPFTFTMYLSPKMPCNKKTSEETIKGEITSTTW